MENQISRLRSPSRNCPLEASAVVAVFMLYMLSTAVRETRDLHVEENHLHEDVRKMTEEMEEHSLFGWAALFVVWGIVVIINAWSGAHFVSDRFADRWGVLTLHVLTAPLVLGGRSSWRGSRNACLDSTPR